MPRAAADVENWCGRWGQVLQQLLVHHVGAHVALDGGIGLVGEVSGQTRTGPGGFAHRANICRCSDPGGARIVCMRALCVLVSALTPPLPTRPDADPS